MYEKAGQFKKCKSQLLIFKSNKLIQIFLKTVVTLHWISHKYWIILISHKYWIIYIIGENLEKGKGKGHLKFSENFGSHSPNRVGRHQASVGSPRLQENTTAFLNMQC